MQKWTYDLSSDGIIPQCSRLPCFCNAGKEGQFEREGYGQRPYDNWDRIMFDCRGQVMEGEDVATALLCIHTQGIQTQQWHASAAVDADTCVGATESGWCVQDFDTVMSALGSNNERWGINDITLELLRPAPGAAAAASEQQEAKEAQQS